MICLVPSPSDELSEILGVMDIRLLLLRDSLLDFRLGGASKLLRGLRLGGASMLLMLRVPMLAPRMLGLERDRLRGLLDLDIASGPMASFFMLVCMFSELTEPMLDRLVKRFH